MLDPLPIDLTKLNLVPVLALRALCLQQVIPPESYKSINRKSQADLLQYVHDSGRFTQVDIDNTYDNYRYGHRRLSLQLYLIPENHVVEADPETVYSSFSAELHQPENGVSPNSENDDGEATTDQPKIKMLRALDHVEFGNLMEFRYKYLIPIVYLDQEEKVDHVFETRYGFIWINVQQQFVVLLSRDERLNELLLAALGKALQTTPGQVHMPKDIVDKHFPKEKMRSASYVDPNTGVRRAISGNSGMFEQCPEEIEHHEEESVRTGIRYDEQITQNVKSPIGLTQSKGRFYFARILSAPDLREWAERRLPLFVSDVREWSHHNRLAIGKPSRLNISDHGKYYISEIVSALISMRRRLPNESVDRNELQLDFSIMDMVREVGNNYFKLHLHINCDTCDQDATECPDCHNQTAVLFDEKIMCANCRHIHATNSVIELMCPSGHIQCASVSSAILLVPQAHMEKAVEKHMIATGLVWDRSAETFVIDAQGIHILQKSVKNATNVINNYVNLGAAGAIGTGAHAQKFEQTRN